MPKIQRVHLGESNAASDRQAFAAAREICRRRGGDVYLAAFFLPRAKREAVHAVLAFSAMLVDAVATEAAEERSASPTTVGTGCCSTSSLEQRAGLIRKRLEQIYASPSSLAADPADGVASAILWAFARTVHRRQIPIDYFLDLLEGAKIEASARRFATWKSLDRCLTFRWGSIALAVAAVVGVTSSDARQPIIDLGKAVGLTKVMRDTPSHASRGRLMLPIEDLARSGVSEREVLRGDASGGGIRRLMACEAGRARVLFASGRRAIPWLAGDGSRLMAAAAAVMYEGMLDVIEQQRWGGRVASLTVAQRLRRIGQVWRVARGA